MQGVVGQFNAQLPNWDPNAWAEIFARAGARYVVLVDIVSKNGNLLLNVGPCADGTLHTA